MPVTVQLLGVQAVRDRIRSIRAAWDDAPRKAVHDAAEELKPILKEEAPERTGALRKSIRYRTERTGPAVAARFSAIEYAPFVVKGTAPHDIWAGFYTSKEGGARVLHFVTSSGAEVFTPYVRHPGTQPDDFPERALRRAGPRVREILRATGLALVSGGDLGADLGGDG